MTLKKLAMYFSVPALVIALVSCSGTSGYGSLLDVALETSETASLANVVVFIDTNGTNPVKLSTDVLDGDANFTVFAPNNAAFIDVFGPGDGDGIVEAAEISASGLAGSDQAIADALFPVVAAHVAPGIYSATDVIAGAGTPFAAVEGNLTAGGAAPDYTITSDLNGSAVVADIVATDVPADNGIVHLIDAILGL